MSDIKVGDLVVVIKSNGCSCAAPSKTIGLIFRVNEIRLSHNARCGACKIPMEDTICAFGDLDDGAFDMPRLKRIPPLSELEGQRTEEKIKEPA